MVQRILFQSRKTLFTVPGGDTIQIMKTAEYLRMFGCHVDISTDLEPDVSRYDLIHLFNLMRPQEIYIQALNGKKYGKKVALSPIYGPYTEYYRNEYENLIELLLCKLKPDHREYLKIIGRALLNGEVHKGTLVFLKKGPRELQKQILKMIDILLPNAEGELKRVIEHFPEAKGKKYVIVPNSIDTKLFNREVTEITPEIEKFRNCVLCVGRLEGRKSQLKLIRAMKGLPWPLVLIGKPAKNHSAYVKKIKQEMGPNVYLIGQVDHSQLPKFYKVAKVHALVSWMETPGLSSLEAGAMGCNLVITDKGDTREYFDNYAFYCNPKSIDSIREAIIKAYEAPPNPELRERIMKNFTWEKAAEKTLEGYKKILS